MAIMPRTICAKTPEKVIDYAMKTIKRGNVDYDTALILPKSLSELKDPRIILPPKEAIIRDVLGRYNLSQEIAEAMLEQCLAKKGTGENSFLRSGGRDDGALAFVSQKVAEIRKASR